MNYLCSLYLPEGIKSRVGGKRDHVTHCSQELPSLDESTRYMYMWRLPVASRWVMVRRGALRAWRGGIGCLHVERVGWIIVGERLDDRPSEVG